MPIIVILVSVRCRRAVVPGGESCCRMETVEAPCAMTPYKKFGLTTDTILIISERNKSILQDATLREKSVMIILACSGR
jgi:hypothetical protein